MTCRKLVFAVVAVVALTGLLASVARANCGGCGSKPKVTTLAGTVKSVDAKARTLVLTVGGCDSAKDVSLKVCPKVTIMVGGKKATLADVKAGAKAQVCHNKDLVAVRITVGGSGCPKS